METIQITAQTRKEVGKGAARKTRARGLVPGIFYGRGLPSLPITVLPVELVKALSTERGRNALIQLRLDDESEFVMVRELSLDPVTRKPLHVDLYRVALDREICVEVPFRTHGRAIGVQKGGELRVVLRTLPVLATPEKIPGFIEVDVSAIELNQGITAGELKAPDGVRVALDPSRTVVAVVTKKKEPVEAEAEAKKPTTEAPPAGAAAATTPSKTPSKPP